MMYRIASVLCMALAVVVLSQAAAMGQVKEDKNTHLGTFVSVKGGEFVMETKGKEHSHTLAKDAKVTGPDGKECRIDDLVKGQTIRVTTKDGDTKVATKVEVVRKKETN